MREAIGLEVFGLYQYLFVDPLLRMQVQKLLLLILHLSDRTLHHSFLLALVLILLLYSDAAPPEAFLHVVDFGNLEQPVNCSHQIAHGGRCPDRRDRVTANLPTRIAQGGEKRLDLVRGELGRGAVVRGEEP